MPILPEKLASFKTRLRLAVQSAKAALLKWFQDVQAMMSDRIPKEWDFHRISEKARDRFSCLAERASAWAPKVAAVKDTFSEKARRLSEKAQPMKEKAIRFATAEHTLNIAMPVACALVLISVVSIAATSQGASARSAASSGEETVAVNAMAQTPRYAAPGNADPSLLEDVSGETLEAAGVYVDNKLYGAMESEAQLQFFLDALLNNGKEGDANALTSFVQTVEVVKGLYPPSSIKDYDDMKETLLEILQVKLTRAESYQAEIPFETVTVNNELEYTGFSNVVNAGVNGVRNCVDAVSYVNGQEIDRTEVSREIAQAPVDETIEVGTQTVEGFYPEGYLSGEGSGTATGSFLWPLPYTTYITSPFEYRWGAMHNGVDISDSGVYGHTVVASDGGVVTVAGDLNDGYGNYVVIDHGNGYKTLYGHGSAIYVQQGQRVSRGQPILAVGNTGNSYGAHLHFEIIENGVKTDPLTYDFVY